jgi:hypothetical protein
MIAGKRFSLKGRWQISETAFLASKEARRLRRILRKSYGRLGDFSECSVKVTEGTPNPVYAP